MAAGGTAPISRSRAMPPAPPHAGRPGDHQHAEQVEPPADPWVAPLMANTKVAPRSIASNSIAPDYTDCTDVPKWQSAARERTWPRARTANGGSFASSSAASGCCRRRGRLVLLAALPEDLRLATRFILAWDLTALLYISLTMWMIHCSTVEDCHDHAALYDEGDWVILLLVIASVAASFVCIAVELPVLKSPQHSLVLGIFITGLTVALSWTFTHTVFTLHYANVYYRPDDDGPGGLASPASGSPTIATSSTIPSSSAARRRPATSPPSRVPCAISPWCTASWPLPSTPPSSR